MPPQNTDRPNPDQLALLRFAEFEMNRDGTYSPRNDQSVVFTLEGALEEARFQAIKLEATEYGEAPDEWPDDWPQSAAEAEARIEEEA